MSEDFSNKQRREIANLLDAINSSGNKVEWLKSLQVLLLLEHKRLLKKEAGRRWMAMRPIRKQNEEKRIIERRKKAERMEKHCSICKILKNIEEFGLDKMGIDGRERRCKKCVSLKSQKTYWKNPEMAKKKSREQRINNPILAEKLRKQCRAYQKQNRDKINKRRRERISSSPKEKITKSCRDRLTAIIKKGLANKIVNTKELYGCTIEQLKAHLESKFRPGMTWKNYGFHGWHIDHIVPCAAFDLTKLEEQKKCFHYTNLQPLWRFENQSKGNRIISETMGLAIHLSLEYPLEA